MALVSPVQHGINRLREERLVLCELERRLGCIWGDAAAVVDAAILRCQLKREITETGLALIALEAIPKVEESQ